MTPEETHALAGHDAAWHEERRRGIGGSDAKKIVDGDWYDLWCEKTGRVEPEDLSDVLPVQLGSYTEPFNLAWFQRHAGKPVCRDGCEHLVHPEYKFMRANLDGRIVNERAFVEAKHVNAFAKDTEIVTRYYPQIQHCLAVTGLDLCYLSIIIGTMKYEYFEVARDDDFIERLIIRECEFWGHVETDTSPAPVAPQPVAIALDDMREVDMEDSNAWAVGAADWLENKAGATKFKAAEKAIKELMEADVKRAFGKGVECKRARDGKLSIKEVK